MATKKRQTDRELLAQTATAIDGRWNDFLTALDIKAYFPSNGEARIDCPECVTETKTIVLNLSPSKEYPTFTCNKCHLEKRTGNSFIDLVKFLKWNKQSLTLKTAITRIVTMFKRHLVQPNVVRNRKYQDCVFSMK
jgi:hypothetical protein